MASLKLPVQPRRAENDMLGFDIGDDLIKIAHPLLERRNRTQSRDMLLVQLEDTEMDHAYYLEKQLRLIDAVGLPNYLQSQMGSGAPQA